MSGYRPVIGHRVRTYVEGILTAYNEGVYTVKGNSPGAQHIDWVHEFHWGTEFERLPDPEPKWQPGDVVQIHGGKDAAFTLLRMAGADAWSCSRETGHDQHEHSDEHTSGMWRRGEAVLIVRAGKPVQP